MFKKKIVALLTCFFVASNAMATNAYAIKSKELATTKQTIASKEIEEMSSTDGFVAEKNGDYIIVVGEAEEGSHNQLILAIDDETEIVDTKGKKLSKDKIKNASVVEVFYEAQETNNVLPFVIAEKIIIKDGAGIEGTVLKIRKSNYNNYYYLTIEEEKDDYKREYTLIIEENTELIDKDGDKLSIYDIEKDMNIVGIHHLNSTTSIPPQSNAFKIIVMEGIKENKNIVEGMVDVIVPIENKTESELNKEAYLTVLGKGMTEDTDGNLNSFITKNTNIINEDGEEVALEKIKQGSVVEVIYSKKSSDDNESTIDAEKIIIKNSNGIKGNILGINEYGDKSFILIRGYQQTNNYAQMALIFGENTEILDIKGNKLSLYDLNQGMEIVGIHSMTSTMSSPPQSQAYTIIVTSEVKEIKQAVEGMIYNVPNSNKKRISVVGESLTENAPNFVDLYINDDTEIVNEQGQKLDLNQIKEGTAIKAIFGQKLTKSAIPIGTAEKIVIKNALGIKGEISDTDFGKNYIEIKKSDDLYDSIILKINNDTEIVDLEGKEISKYDLSKGAKVVGIHSLSTTRSIPPQTVAYKIIVLEKAEVEDKYIVEGMVYKVRNYSKKKISIVGESLTENAPNFVDLYINDDTEIVNEQGQKLDSDDLKEGAAIQAIFGKKLTNSTIPIGTAEKIVVKNALGVKGEISRTDDEKTYIEIKKSDNYRDSIILKINNDTEIVDLEGKEISKYDLSKGAKVVGIHSLATTKSLPPQTVAYKIIVLEKAEVEDKYIVEGMVYKVRNYSKKKISIVGEALTENAPNFVDLYINDDTEIVNEQGKKLDLDEIKEQSVVKAIFGQNLTKSSIPIGTAEKIIIKDALGVKGEISETNDKKTYIEIKKSDYLNDRIILKINNDTEIVDIDGNELSKEELTKGAKVVGIHSLVTTKSMPPQTVAYRIIVLEKAEVEDKYMVEGLVYKVRDDYKTRISIMGEALTKNAPNFVDLYINDDTEIVNEQGKKLDLDEIKEQSVVKAIFGQSLTKSSIPIGTAEKIIVKNAIGIKGEIIDTNNDRTLIEIQKSDDVYYNTVLKINDNTEIIDINGDELSKSDLNEGAVVIGIHSIRTTNSWTSESLAYKIIVLELSDDEDDEDDEDDDDDDDDEYKSEMYIMGYASAYEKHGDKKHEDNMIRVRNQSNGNGKIKEVILEIDKKTEIVDVQGNKVTVEQLLSSGKKVKVYFKASKSKDGTVEGKAKKIVVQGKPVSHGKGHGNSKGKGNKKK